MMWNSALLLIVGWTINTTLLVWKVRVGSFDGEYGAPPVWFLMLWVLSCVLYSLPFVVDVTTYFLTPPPPPTNDVWGPNA